MIHRLAIAAAAILFSTGGAAVKLSGMSGWQVASLRSGLAALVLAALLKSMSRARQPIAEVAVKQSGPGAAEQNAAAQGRPGQVAAEQAAASSLSNRRNIIRVLLIGVAYAATMILFVLANKLTTAANATFLQSSSPLYILALSPWLLSERARRSDYVLMAIIAVGMALFFVQMRSASASAPNPRLGNILGALSGVTYAFMLMGLRWLERAGSPSPEADNTEANNTGAANAGAEAPDEERDSGGTNKRRNTALVAVVVGNLLAALFAAPMAFPVSGSALDWSVIGYLGVIQIGLAYIFLTYGLRRVPAFESSLIILLEPSLSPLWAWLLHDEVPGVLAIAGGVLIVTATTLKSWLDDRKRKLRATRA